MRIQLTVAFVILALVESRAADAQGEIRKAIQLLGNQANYSWNSTTKSEASSSVSRQGPTTGMTEQNGDTHFRFTLDGNPVEVAIRGTKSAIKTETAWESAEDLRGERQWIARRLQAFKPPVAEAEDLLRAAKPIRSERGGIFTADLTPQGVTELLLARSRNDLQTRVSPGAKGSVKLWTKNGLLVKYEYSLQGKIVLTDHKQEFNVSRTTTVEIKDVGTTKIRLPEEARQKLS